MDSEGIAVRALEAMDERDAALTMARRLAEWIADEPNRMAGALWPNNAVIRDEIRKDVRKKRPALIDGLIRRALNTETKTDD